MVDSEEEWVESTSGRASRPEPDSDSLPSDGLAISISAEAALLTQKHPSVADYISSVGKRVSGGSSRGRALLIAGASMSVPPSRVASSSRATRCTSSLSVQATKKLAPSIARPDGRKRRVAVVADQAAVAVEVVGGLEALADAQGSKERPEVCERGGNGAQIRQQAGALRRQLAR